MFSLICESGLHAPMSIFNFDYGLQTPSWILNSEVGLHTPIPIVK